MPYQSVTIATSSAASFSQPVALAWRNGCPTTAAIYPSTTAASSGPFSLQFTLDDVMLVSSSLAKWSTVSSGGTLISSGGAGSIYSSTTVTSDGVYFTFTTPIAALRLSSTTGITGGGVTLKVIQGESW